MTPTIPTGRTSSSGPIKYRATPHYRDENGELLFTRIVEEKKMEQTSGSNGSRKEFLEWQFDYSRVFFKQLCECSAEV